MKTAQRVVNLKTSLTRTLFNQAKNYNDVIDLTLGDPDLSTPEIIKEAAIDSIKNDRTKYSANAGLLSARQAIASHVKKVWNINYSPEDNITLTVGGMEGLFLSLFSTIDIGDEVIVFAPYYPNYIEMIKSCGGVPVIYDCYDPNSGIKIIKKDLLQKVTSKTTSIIINNPGNPTGAVFDKKDLKVIAEIAEEFDLLIISDEVYHSLIYDGKTHNSILTIISAQNRTILIDSLSKEFCMTGYRIGYACGPAFIIKKMVNLQENIAACAPLPSQYALLRAYSETPDTNYIIKEFELRRNILFNELAKCPKIKCILPNSTFYMFVNISATGYDSYTFAEKLLSKKHVAVVPGISYGENYDNYIRIAFTKQQSILKTAATEIVKFIGENNVL